MLKRLIAAVLKAFLMILDKVFLLARKKVVPLYPYDKRTKAITLLTAWHGKIAAGQTNVTGTPNRRALILVKGSGT
jgi:hypothetical protein